MTADVAASSSQPSPGYLLSIGLACVGFACLGISVGGGLIAKAGGDPMRAMDVDGMVTFVSAFAIIFACRLIFFKGVGQQVRHVVRTAITVVFCVELLATVFSIWLAASGPPSTQALSLPVWFTTIATLCQIGTLAWLFRYREEGLNG